jgi:hypothetical protein
MAAAKTTAPADPLSNLSARGVAAGQTSRFHRAGDSAGPPARARQRFVRARSRRLWSRPAARGLAGACAEWPTSGPAGAG